MKVMVAQDAKPTKKMNVISQTQKSLGEDSFQSEEEAPVKKDVQVMKAPVNTKASGSKDDEEAKVPKEAEAQEVSQIPVKDEKDEEDEDDEDEDEYYVPRLLSQNPWKKVQRPGSTEA